LQLALSGTAAQVSSSKVIRRARLFGDARYVSNVTIPFATDRARLRGPQILDYAATAGGAVLIDPTGQVVLASGVVAEDVIVHAARHGAPTSPRSFAHDGSCVHARPIEDGWWLCVVPATGVSPVLAAKRAERAAHVLWLALCDRPRAAGGGGSPAPSSLVFVRAVAR